MNIAVTLLFLIFSSVATASSQAPTALFLYGGEVSENHPYASTTHSILSGQNLKIVSASVDRIPDLKENGTPRFDLIIIADASSYEFMNVASKRALDQYCKDTRTGQLFVYAGRGASLNGGAVQLSESRVLDHLSVTADKELLQLLKKRSTFPQALPGLGRILSHPETANYTAIASTGEGTVALAAYDLFRYLLEHRVSFFMSHQSGYARDRVALKTYRQLVQLITKWTNIRLHTGSNATVARQALSQKSAAVLTNTLTL